MPRSLFPLPEENYSAFLGDLKTRIRRSQVLAATALNKEVILLYWQIGQAILQQQQAQGWGAKVIARLAKDLRKEFPQISGFSPRNLNYMRAFAEAYPDETIVQQLLHKVPWGHHVKLLDAVKDPQQRLWYVHKTIENGWSRSILAMQIDSSLYQRQGEAITNFAQVLPSPQSDLAHQLIKDPYNFDFLSLAENVQERDLERGLIDHIRDFLLEMGIGFAFVGSQYRLEVEGDEYFIDLLFYHLKLHCYVVIDLKVTEFKPEYSGKMNFYIAAVNKLLRDEIDQPTIGIILCRSKKKTVVEFALETVQNPIGVSTYRLREELPAVLQSNLPSAEQLGKELESAVAQLESQNLKA
ncbi:MAG: PDDEXK nuclease domain-containing protein [Almyronema sp.]